MTRKRKATRRTKVIRPRKLNVDWYDAPDMVGHDWAKESYVNAWKVKVAAKTQAQKELLNACIDFENTDWHYWAVRLSKKYISHVMHAVKAIGKGESWYEIWSWVNQRSGMMVDNLDRYLEVKAYDENTAEFVKVGSSYNRWLGMPKEDAEERMHNRIKTYRERLGL